jgi:hypothetical protein
MSAVGKIAGAAILNRLRAVVEARRILLGFHFGFHKRHSKTQQNFRLTEWKAWAFSFKKVTGAAFLDFEKTFDRVCQWWPVMLATCLGEAAWP